MIREWLRSKLRDWLLDDAERQVIADVRDLEDDLDRLADEWSEVHRALHNADVLEDEAIIEECDILVLLGSHNMVQGASFDGPIHVSGRDHVIYDNFQRPDADTTQERFDES